LTTVLRQKYVTQFQEMTSMSIHVPLPSPSLQLLEIADSIEAIVENKKDIDTTVTYIILRHNL